MMRGSEPKPVSRRALRSEGIRGSNEALNALARVINAERSLRVIPPQPSSAGDSRSENAEVQVPHEEPFAVTG
jgi:hypothetical protein